MIEQRVVARNELEALGLACIQAFNARDLEAALRLAHPEIVVMPSRVHGRPEGYHGHAGLRELAGDMRARRTAFQVVVSSMQQAERRSGDRRAGSETAPAAPASRRPAQDRSPERRRVQASKLAMFGHLCLDGEALAPWAGVVIVREGLIIRQRSYLSTRELLDEIGVLADPSDVRLAAA